MSKTFEAAENGSAREDGASTPAAEGDNLGSCWICDQRIYTLIFWSESIGFQAAEKVNAKTRKIVMDQIRSKYPTVSAINTEDPQSIIEKRWADLLTMYEDDTTRPLICGEFNNWEPLRMLRVDEFA